MRPLSLPVALTPTALFLSLAFCPAASAAAQQPAADTADTGIPVTDQLVIESCDRRAGNSRFAAW